ncbi:hypothetical protein OQB66_08600 [Pseudomonas syringae]|uniref:hypothetical protein n=1 Tax=Pseudomonas syringae TaxID=317 RepID=UPI00224B2062|nr:hypothetical protein [Pseudomonas syringae]UZS74353.1 hypothetical protein OQB66_08600 [Pseudomonas syringae]
MQSHNYVLGVSGWKMHSNGTLEVNGKIRAVMHDPVEKPETPFAVDGDQVILSQVSIDEGSISPDWGLRTTTNAAGQTVLAGIGGLAVCRGESLTAKIEHEVAARALADDRMSARIAHLEASIQSLRASAGTVTVGFTSSDHREMKP